MTETGTSSVARPAGRIETWAFSIVLSVACLRLLSTFDSFPYWGGDPLSRFAPLVGIGPAVSGVLDGVTLACAAIAIFASSRRGVSVSWIYVVLWSIGALAAFAHFGVGASLAIQHALIGLPWVAALGAGLAVHVLSQDARNRRMVLAVFAGLAAILTCKAAVQVYVEHPALLEAFKHDRLAIFAENGWSPDSSMARSYERRLSHAEATGWIGLANPFATFAAIAATIGFAGMLFPVQRALRERAPWIGLFAAGVFSTYLAGAKGGLASLALGVALLFVARCIPRLKKAGPVIGFAVPFVVLAAVATRGIIGERIGELSILFRSMYAEAALKIFSQNPTGGVGPAGFKDAYLLAKNPLNPEEISSPHSVFLDYLATLGASGIAWICLLLLFCVAAGKALYSAAESPSTASDTIEPATRDDCRRAIAILTIPTLLAAWLETAMATPEGLLVRVGGLVFAAVVVVVFLKNMLSTRVIAAACGAGALVAIAHGQIELTPILPQTVLLFAILVAANPCVLSHKVLSPKRLSLRAVPVVLGALCTFCMATSLVQWQTYMGGAARAIELISTIRQLLALAPRDSRALTEAAAVAAESVGHSVSPQVAAIESALSSIADRAVLQATAELDAAVLTSNGDPATLRAASQFYLQTAGKDGTRISRAEQLAKQAAESRLGRATSFAWIGTIEKGLFDQDKKQARLSASRDAYASAALIDPFSLPPVLKLVELSEAMGDGDSARKWAKKAVELHALMRLDPLKGLSPDQLKRMQRIAE